ncbi:MAG: hypothetical protein ACTSUE_24145 [Promethearchaeota archaeon]
MIENLYVMKENGELIYYKHMRGESIDENILVGFLAAVGNFGRDLFNGMIDAMGVGEDKKLILHFNQKAQLISAAIVDKRDNNLLVKRILREFTVGIVEEYGTRIDAISVDKSLLERDLKAVLKGKIAARKGRNFFFGLLVALAFLYPLFLAGLYAIMFFVENVVLKLNLSSDTALFSAFLPLMIVAIIIYIFILYLFPMLLSGFVAGQFRFAVWIGVIFHGATLVLYVLSRLVETMFITLSFTPVIIIFMLFFSYIGVRIANRKKLYR